MLPAYLYTPIYHHAMLLVVIACALVYWAGQHQLKSLTLVNQAAMIVVGIVVLLFMGLRPISGVFLDMVDYARAYDRVQQGAEGSYRDSVFNMLMHLCSPILPVEGFFLVCALLYIAPLAIAFRRIHRSWAFPVFLASLTAMSFWAYGVNGIRNGMATSVLILAFAFYDRTPVMLSLMATACGLHGSVMLPAVAFLLVRYMRRTEYWLGFWIACVAVSLGAGNVGEMVLGRYNPFAWDERAGGYILGPESSGFRADFLAYSILPVVATLLLAAPTRLGRTRVFHRLLAGRLFEWKWNRTPLAAPAIAGKTLAFAATRVRRTEGVLASPLQQNRDLDAAPNSSLNQLGRRPKGTMHPRSGWESLPWVRLLRQDPFYARLVNTYLFANALWVLLIHASFSNRFAYLSWFMMPWVLAYPFVPGRFVDRPRLPWLVAVLCAQYAFTYFMVVVVYPLRGLG